MPLSTASREILLNLARESIEFGIKTGKQIKITEENFSPELREQRATFVTLERLGKLRGCVGMLEAYQSLVADVANSAYFAAFRDNRFVPLRKEELADLEIHISVLSPLEDLSFSSEADLRQKMRPGIDGLVLSDGSHRGTFLPVMWGELQTPEEFLGHLKIKAGLPFDYWSESLRVERYTTEKIP